MKKKLSLILAAMLALQLALTGCGGGDQKSEGDDASKEANQKTDIVIATAVDFITMDPADANDTLSGSCQRTMMEGLFGFDNNMKVIPLLAESYTANENATEYTFKLRQGIKFSDGTPWNADAAIVNFDRLKDQSQGLKRNSLFKMIKENQKIDEYTFKMVLSEPFGAMIGTLAHPAGLMVSPKALEEYGKDVSQHPVGTGQFIFKEWKPGESLTIVRNDDYWGEKSPFTSVTFKPVTDNGARVSMLQAGDADFIFPVPTEQIEALKKDDSIQTYAEPSIVVRYVTMNTAKKPFNDVRVRQALNYAVDKDAYSKIVYNGFTEDMDSLVAKNITYYSPQTPYEYNIEKAKQLLAEAGYPDGFETTLWAGNTTTSIKATQFIQQQLEKIGVKVKVENMEVGTLDDKLTKYPKGTPGTDVGVDMYLIGWSSSTGDADWNLRPLLCYESIPPVSYNISYYNNPAFDKLIYEGLGTADETKRGDAYAQAQKVLWDDAPMIFLSADQNVFASSKRIEGVCIIPDGSLSLREGKFAK